MPPRFAPAALAAALAVALYLSPPAPARAEEGAANAGAALGRALVAAQAKDWAAAEAEARLSGPLAFDIITWQRLRAGEGSFADYADFAARRADWPGMALLRAKGEARLADQPASAVLAYFATTPPQTGAGALALVAAHLARGQAAEAEAAAAQAWRGLDLSAEDQAAFLASHADLLAPHHGGRMQALLDRGALAQARALLPHVSEGTRAVAEARIALQARAKGVDAAIKAVPEHMAGSAGLARDRAQWRWRGGLEEGAAEIVLARSKNAQSLGEPALWATLRGQLARYFLRAGNAGLAYRLAARHRLEPGSTDWGDLEFLAGFAALKLGDAPAALGHFEALASAVSGPISTARAGYWRGRALEQAGRSAEAQAAFAEAGRWQTAYYGLLAAERAGLALDAGFAAPPALPGWQDAPFTSAPVFQAAQLLQAAGETELAERFVLHLEESLPPAEAPALARLAEDWGNAHLALSLAKRAATRGEIWLSAYYPLPEGFAEGLGVPQDLALAIARRESEFDPKVVSPAGARGLMQLMPGTARMMAEKLGLGYEPGRLTSDPAYNAQLGGAYLATLRAEFGASPVLVAVGYNAGPGRARRWIEELGDPRLASADVVDWVEMIPFTETRNYVMRVAESLPVYRARLGLGGAAAPLRFSALLRGAQE